MMKLKTQSQLKAGTQRPALKGSEALVLNVFNELVKYGSYKYMFIKHRVHRNNPFLGWPLKPKSSSC